MWKDGTDSIYDGVHSGPLYSRWSLDADLAAAELVVDAIRFPQIIASPDSELSVALQHGMMRCMHARNSYRIGCRGSSPVSAKFQRCRS